MCVRFDIVRKIKLCIPAGIAAAVPPLGPILGQYGLNTVQFCKDFNDATEGLTLFYGDGTEDILGGFILIVDIFIKDDRSYEFKFNKPPVSFLVKTLAGVSKGAPNTMVGTLRSEELLFLAQFKFPNMHLPSACKLVVGTARSIGVVVVA